MIHILRQLIGVTPEERRETAGFLLVCLAVALLAIIATALDGGPTID